MKGFWSGGRLVLRKEASGIARLNSRRNSTAASTQAFTRWDNRKIRGHYMRFTQFVLFHATAETTGGDAASEISRRYAGNGPAHVRIRHHQIGIGEKWLTSADCQRSNKSAAAVHHIDIGDADHVDAIEASPIPGIEGIMRPHGEPSNGSETKSYARPKSDEEYKCRRP
jgi:hypothetical protein